MNTQRRWSPVTVAIVAASLLGLRGLPGAVARAAESLEVLPHWEMGEKVRYELIKARRRTQGKLVVLNATSRTDLDVEVLDTHDDGYVVAWTFGATRFDDPQQADGPVVPLPANVLEGQRIVLELDPQAVITGVRNWRELKEASVKLMQSLAAEPKTADLEQAPIANLRTQVASMFVTRQQVEQLCTREAQMFHMALGIEVAPSAPLEYADSLPNPFGGEPFPSRARFALETVDRGGDRAVVTWTQAVAPDDARRIMETTLRAMAARLGRPVPNAEQLEGFTIEDRAEFVLEMSTGWVDRLTHVRTTRTGADLQEDETTITRTATRKTE